LLQPGSFGKILDAIDERDSRAARDEDDRSIVSPLGVQIISGEAMMVYSLNFWSWENEFYLNPGSSFSLTIPRIQERSPPCRQDLPSDMISLTESMSYMDESIGIEDST